jgi:GABA(A) receptor-associated protein
MKSLKSYISTPKQSFKFDREYSEDQRKLEADRILQKYPERIPVIVEPSAGCKVVIDKYKYLVPADLTVGQFIFVIRKRLKMQAEKALFLFVGDSIPASSSTMATVYHAYKSKDGFLKIRFSEENVFG